MLHFLSDRFRKWQYKFKWVNIGGKMQMVTKRMKKVNVRKTLLKGVFSHFGLIVLLIVYTIVGALLFQVCELSTLTNSDISSNQKFAEIEKKRTQLAVDLKDIGANFNYSVKIEDIRSMLDDFHAAIADGIQNGGYKGSLIDEPGSQWSISSAIVFALSITTTIGYGNVYPVTDMGRTLVILYALFGIPFFLIFLTDHGVGIGSFMRRLFLNGCCHWPRRKREENLLKARWFWLRYLPRREAEEIIEKHPIKNDDNYVPVSLLVFLILVYAVLGSIMFWQTEGWTFLQSIYFVFVSLLTIGFGDFVPGYQNVGTPGGRLRLVVSAFYIAAGLALLSMGIGLVVEECFNKASKVAAALKFAKESQELNEEDMMDDIYEDNVGNNPPQPVLV